MPSSTVWRGVVRRRAALGVPVTTVGLDPISDAGQVACNQRIADYLRPLGFDGVGGDGVIALIKTALADGRPEAVVAALNRAAWSKMSAGAAAMPLLAQGRTVSASTDRALGRVRERIIAAPPAEQLAEEAANLRVEIAKILRRPEDRINPDASLADLGVDSLNMGALGPRMDSKLAVSLALSLAMMSPTPITIAGEAVRQPTLGKIAEAGAPGAWRRLR
jgi:phthiocerol/phenolphthiocerol synthesis type-I polyketide synthase C